MKTPVLALCAAILLSGTFVPSSQAQDAGKQGNPRWEYRVLRVTNRSPDTAGRTARSIGDSGESVLNKMGADGWELVAVREQHDSSQTVFYLKRRR